MKVTTARKSPSSYVLKLLLGLSALLFLIWFVGSKEVVTLLLSVDPWLFALLMGVSGVLIQISILKWRLFLRFYGESASLRELFSLYLVGYFFNTFFPSQVGGDAVRSWSLGKRVGQRVAFSATLLERATGFVTMILFGGLGVMCAPNVPSAILLVYAGVASATLIGIVIVLNKKSAHWFLKLIPNHKYREKFRLFHEGMARALTSKGVLIKAFGLSVLFHGMAVLNTILAGYVVGWKDAGFFDVCVVLPLILLFGSIPLSPSGLGIQEGAFYFFLQSIGASPSQSIATALILRIKVLALAVCGGGVWLFRSRS
jgi:uncharacterized protein (TIRG00374 family)